jgi:hypothetical protein
MTAPHGVPLTGPEAMQEVIHRRAMLKEYSFMLHAQEVLSCNGRDMVSCSHATRDNDRAVRAFSTLIDFLD